MIKPLDNRIIVKPFETETMRSSGIIIPESAAEKPLSGTVISIGPGKKTDSGRDPMMVKEGDKIMYGQYAPQAFEYEGQNFLSMCEMDVLFIME